jgi:hypothetical protein
MKLNAPSFPRRGHIRKPVHYRSESFLNFLCQIVYHFRHNLTAENTRFDTKGTRFDNG